MFFICICIYFYLYFICYLFVFVFTFIFIFVSVASRTPSFGSQGSHSMFFICICIYFYLYFICYFFYICIGCLSYATSWRSGCHVLCFPFVYQSYGLSNAVCSAVFLLKVLLDHIMQDSECFIVCNCNLITVRCCFLMYF